MEAKTDKLTVWQKVAGTVVSPILYQLTNFEYSNPEKKSYWAFLKDIWRG